MQAKRDVKDGSRGVTATRLAEYLLAKGIGGIGPISSAEALGREYLDDPRYESLDERVDGLIERETIKNFTTGFVTGVGGVITLPVAVPSALGASWILQARMAGAIAYIYGHDLASPRVRTSILLSLAGDVARDALRPLGLQVGQKLSQRALDQVPGRALVEVNKRIALRLVARAGERTIASFSRWVPLVGGVVGGVMDAAVCRKVGATAKALHRRANGVVIDGEIVEAP
jgi:uncharacterized protein (DUF697 family)